MVLIVFKRHLTVDSLRFKVDFFKHHQKLIHLWGFVPLHSTTNKKVVCCTWSCKTFFAAHIVNSSYFHQTVELSRTCIEHWKTDSIVNNSTLLDFSPEEKPSYSRKNCQNFLKNSIESKLCLARCVTFWWEDALCEALRFHKETWEEK